MNFILVPFLLATRLVTDEEAWKHGPEYTFHARVSMISELKMDKGQFQGTTLMSKLRCRPKEPERLICRFDETKFTRISPSAFGPIADFPEANATYSEFGFGNVSFEMKFTDRGIESYVFVDDERLMGEYLTNQYRLIANQLNVGARIDEEKYFKIMENSTAGECPVTVNVSRKNANEEVGKKKIHLISLTDLYIGDDETLTIEKERHLADCIPHSVYFFGTRHTYGIIPLETIEKLISSTSRMIVSKSSFSSETVNIVDLYDVGREKIGRVLDHIHVSLGSIDPSRSTLHSPKATFQTMSIGLVADKYENKCL